jgi:hypothetical protein
MAVALVAAVLAPAGPWTGPGAASAQVVAPEAADFASEAYGNPWDFADAADTSGMALVHNDTVPPTYEFPTPAGGDLAVTTRPHTQLLLLRDWGTGALATGRDGPARPIDAGRYRWLSFEVTLPAGATGVHGAVFWSRCVGCSSARSFSLSPGRHRYSIPLHQGGTLVAGPWSGAIRSLVLTPNAEAASVPMTFHWIRVHAGPGGSDPGTSWVPGPPEPRRSGWPAVDGRPRPVVVDPDLAGGQDYATTVRGDPWDMAQLSDVAGSANTALTIDGGNLRGTSAGPAPNDPVVLLASPGPINTRRWHRLTLQVAYAGPFGLHGGPGGGMVGRWIWRNPLVPGGTQESNDLVVTPGPQRITVDLHTDPPSAVNDDEIPHRAGWGAAGSMWLDTPRWDPHEDPGARVWWLEDVRLARNDLADPTFTIRFRDDAWEPGTTARLSLVEGPRGTAGTALHGGTLPLAAGENTFLLDARTLPAQGVFHVRLEVTDPGGTTATAWSTGPVETGTPVEFTDVDPHGSFMADVSWVVKEGVADGYDPDTFGSTAPVSRQAMAAFLARLFGPSDLPACSADRFPDVPAGHRFCAEIAWLVEAGIARGYGDGTFRPTAPVSRQAMAAFVHRAVVGGQPDACTRRPFPDVVATTAFCGHIAWMAGTGITGGYPDGTFRPTAPVSRQAMARFLRLADARG